MSDPVATAPDGAFVIGGGFGQDINEESVRSLFAVPSFGSGSTTSLFESQLLKLPLDALKQFLPMIPGASESDFANTGSAVSSIMGSLVDGPNVVIKTLQATINQIIDLFQGLVVTPINTAVQGVADWFRELVGWQDTTEAKQADLANSVWSGATSQPVEADRTALEVQSAVAAMKARAEALRNENELRYRSSVPLYQGLIPGGDVTCNLEVVSTADSLTGAVTGSSARTDSHDHGPGSYVSNIALPSTPAATSNGTLSTGPMSTFRVRSDTPRNVISFLGKTTGSITQAYVSLWSYDFDLDVWRCVSASGNIADSLSAEYDWVDASLLQEYSPSMSELMGVRWSVAGTGQLHVASSFAPSLIPKYHSVPYGSVVSAASNIVPGIGDTMSLPHSANWWNGRIPFAQIAPDLGQVFETPPQYWFDDFNTDTNSMYSRNGNAKIQNGVFHVNGNADGTQSIVYKGQMSTPSFTVAATASNYSVHPAYMRHGSTVNATSGVSLKLTWHAIRDEVDVTLSTVSGSNSNDLTTRATAVASSRADRWSISFDDATKVYTVKQGNDVVITWADPNNLALRGKGKRSAGIAVSRLLFVNSGGWDDLLINDNALSE